MKKIMKLTFEGLILAATSFGTVAQAQPYPGQYEQRDHHDQRDENRDRDRDRNDRDHNDRGEHRWHNYGGQYGYNGYHGRWRTGQRYTHFRDDRYVIRDYRAYDLPPPRPGYRYYRDDNGDVVMAAIAGGVIGLILGGALSNDHHGHR